MAKKFIHLHLHTEYSLLDGMSQISDLLIHIKENGMDSVALTDHGVMYGAVEFYKKCKKEGVKPIIGMEAYTTNVELDIKPERGKFKNFHLLLLAKNKTGYKNLMKLTSIAHLEGYYYRPRITREILKSHSKGLIVTSACPAGEIARSLTDGDYDGARDIAQWFLDVFKDDYYLEIQRHKYHEHLDTAPDRNVVDELTKMSEVESTINAGVIKLSGSLGIPLVATNDVHYIRKEDAQAQDALVCVATGKDVEDTKRLRFIDTPEYYAKTPEEMSELFPEHPEALENTLKIAEKCNVELTLGKFFFPKIELPTRTTPKKYLKDEVDKGLVKRYGKISKEIRDRADFELDVILEKGYSEYFLIFKDMADWARERNIPINTRGSAAGSIVSYSLGITSVDPIRFILPFERFLNPYRPSAPDIDLDIADDSREEMLEYLVEKYGREKVAQICTFGRMLARGSVRDIARVLGYPYETGDKIAKAIPMGSQGFPMTIDRALEDSPELKSLYENDSDSKKVIDLAKQIEGNARHISVHAAGVVISPGKLVEFTPVQKEPSGDKIITQYEMHALEDIGLVKLDVLGIRNLAILRGAIEWVSKTRGETINLDEIPLDDTKTYEMLTRGETMGTFQLGGSGMTRFLKDMAPTQIEDIMMMIALFRPGPMNNIEEYIARKKGEKPVTYYHPKMEKYLDKSLGVLVYQDDLLYTAIELAGYDWVEVDKFRKAVGKKIPAEMARQHIKFVDGCVEYSGMSKEEAEGLWDLFEPFQGYGFNKAHAASYGMVSYQTSYLKANYPVEYMCALLTCESNNTDKLSSGIAEARRMGITVLPPDINESAVGFVVIDDEDSLDGRAVRFGLGAIKNVGVAAIESILESRAEGEFMSFADFISRVDNRKINKRVLESLIKVGAFDRFGKRAALIESMDEVRARVAKPSGNDSQQGLFGEEEIKESMKTEDDRINLNDREFSDEEMENFERELMGFSLSAKPVSDLLGGMTYAATHKIDDVSIENDLDTIVKLALVVSDVRVVVTKKTGAEMAFVRGKDDSGGVDLVVFPQLYGRTKDVWQVNKPILVSGKVNNRDDTLSVIVEGVESGGQTSDHLYIKVPKTADAKNIKRLRGLLVENEGEQNVSLVFEGNKEQLDLKIKVNWTKGLARQISEVLES